MKKVERKQQQAQEFAFINRKVKNKRRRTLYQIHKEQARETAQEWQADQSPKSWGQLAEECANLEQLARRYGLIKEFKREGIL